MTSDVMEKRDMYDVSPDICCHIDLVPVAVAQLVPTQRVEPQLLARQLVHLKLEIELMSVL